MYDKIVISGRHFPDGSDGLILADEDSPEPGSDDCEGFSGSDNPVSRQILSEASRDFKNSSGMPKIGGLTPFEQYREHESTATNGIDIHWGELDYTSIYPDDRGRVTTETRKNIVKHVYPRLLYAFSDVICFVCNNTKASSDILETLFAWAKDGHEKTLNQRVRPGLIIILNKIPVHSRDGLRDAKVATSKLLRSFEKSDRFEELRRRWRRRGRSISNAEELVLCYYDFFRVISIPTYDRQPTTTDEIAGQIKGLYSEISSVSDHIREKRRSFNMDLDVANLDAYLKTTATILGHDYRNALDFHEVLDGDANLPTSFGEHLARVLWNMVKIKRLNRKNKVGGEVQLLEDMVPYLAACIAARVDFFKRSKLSLLYSFVPLLTSVKSTPKRELRDEKRNSKMKLGEGYNYSEADIGGVSTRTGVDVGAQTTSRATKRVISSIQLMAEDI
ncbi:hypothetical protein GQ53DRAFT_826146 [Thozetella sp. PMI_491]|nr:hypothetical protein GQ53DRAFT_826146 [Thozetella sp. PMI_491]